MKKILGILALTLICCINLIADLNEGLVAHYPFSGNANDESGNNNHGIENGTTLTTDRFGINNCAYVFDGVENRIDLPQLLENNCNEFSINVWVKPQSRGAIFGQFESNYGGVHHYISTTGFSTVEYDEYPPTGGSIQGNINIFDDNWHFLSIVKSGTNRQIYVDSILDVEDNQAEVYTGPNTDLCALGVRYRFGVIYQNGVSIYSGKMDDVRIYNRALSESEIQELYFYSNFIVSKTNPYIGEEIQFTDISTGNPTTFEWDFENDGIYDSFIQNPTHTYNSEGIYSVKLKIFNGTLVDSLIKENLITVSYCPPASPQNVNVEIIQTDAVISWTEVDTTECGSQTIPDGYVIQYSEVAQDSAFYYLWSVSNSQTSFTHNNVVRWSDEMFYKVFAFKDYNREQMEYLESLNQSKEKLKWSEVKQKLEEKRGINFEN